MADDLSPEKREPNAYGWLASVAALAAVFGTAAFRKSLHVSTSALIASVLIILVPIAIVAFLASRLEATFARSASPNAQVFAKSLSNSRIAVVGIVLLTIVAAVSAATRQFIPGVAAVFMVIVLFGSIAGNVLSARNIKGAFWIALFGTFLLMVAFAEVVAPLLNSPPNAD